MCGWLDVGDAKIRSEIHSRIDVDPNAVVSISAKRANYRVLAVTFAAGVFVGWLIRVFG